MLGAFDPVRRRLLVHTSPTKRSTDFVALLDQLGAAYGTAERTRPLVAVLDNGPIHRSKLTTRALAERTWLTLEWLPKYAPELNDPERCWRDLKQHQRANRTFADPDALECAIPDAVARLNHERQLKSSHILLQPAQWCRILVAVSDIVPFSSISMLAEPRASEEVLVFT